MRGFTPSTISRIARPHGQIRFNSSTTESAQKKASEALSRAGKLYENSVTPERVASVKNAGQKLMESGQKFGNGLLVRLGPTGEKLGSFLGAYKKPVMYNLSVARELAKQVYVAESLAPPKSLDALKSAYSTLWSRASSPTYWRTVVSNGEILKLGVYGVEAYGLFKIGEILGRRHLVGYELH